MSKEKQSPLDAGRAQDQHVDRLKISFSGQAAEELAKQDPGGKKAQIEIEKAKQKGFLIGVKVRVPHASDEIGEIVGYNEQTSSLYPGFRYPVLVKFKRGTFEYGIDSLELIHDEK